VKVSVKLYALLRKYHPGPNRSDPLEVDLPEGAVIADVLPALNLPAHLVHSVSLNHQISRLEAPLKEQDRIGLFPPVVGGSPEV